MLRKNFLKSGLIVIAAVLFAVPLHSYAGCDNNEAKARMVDAATGKSVKKFGKGELVQCANMHGGFTSFQNKKISFGVANCIDQLKRDLSLMLLTLGLVRNGEKPMIQKKMKTLKNLVFVKKGININIVGIDFYVFKQVDT